MDKSIHKISVHHQNGIHTINSAIEYNGKSIAIKGQSKELTILDGNGTTNLFNISLDAPSSSLIDITIQNGNSTSGVFDLKLRNGNPYQHEFTGQFGLFGIEALAEGPLSKNGNSNYLVMGRYSTLSAFKALGIQIGTDAVPVYGDGAFKFNWKLKNGGYLSWWAMGGKSNIDIKISDQTEYSTEFYGEGDRDQYFGTSMYVSGLTYKKTLNKKTYFTSTLAGSVEEQHARHDYLQRNR